MSRASLKPSKLDKAIYDYTCAILKGTAAGLSNIAELVTHPIDNAIYPLSALMYDAALIYTAHLSAPDIDPGLHDLNAFLQHCPSAYRDAHIRMQTRIESIQKIGLEFADASGPQRAEMLSEFTAGIFVPGYVLKGVKSLRTLSQNHREFGTFSEPPKYHNTQPRSASHVPPDIKQWSFDDIRGISGDHNNFIYVVTEDRKLLIAERQFDFEFVDSWDTSFLCHDELAGLKPIYAAGELYVTDGRIRGINNCTGHYLVDDSVGGLVENFFIRDGFDEAAGKYKPFISLDRTAEVKRPIKTFSETQSLRLKNAEISFSLSMQVVRQFYPENASHESVFLRSVY